MTAASENLRSNQEQADMDGCMVKVSRQAVGETLAQYDDFTEALQRITEASGPFSRDPIEHAHNALRDMQRTAVLVLKKHGVAPRRDDDVIDGEPIS